jgi:hypothetical protein
MSYLRGSQRRPTLRPQTHMHLHLLGLLPSITFCTIMATYYMFTDTLRTENRCCQIRDGKTSRIEQHLLAGMWCDEPGPPQKPESTDYPVLLPRRQMLCRVRSLAYLWSLVSGLYCSGRHCALDIRSSSERAFTQEST